MTIMRDLVDFSIPAKNGFTTLPMSFTGARGACAIDRLAVFLDSDAARPDWEKLQAEAAGSAYQTIAFFEAAVAWTKAQPLIVVGYDDSGVPVMLLPLVVMRRGFMTVASFPGASNSNLNVPLIRPGLKATPAQAKDLLIKARALAFQRGVAIDAFIFQNQPVDWPVRNPFAALSAQPSPSDCYAGALAEITPFAVHDSKAARKRWRQKTAYLEKCGAISCRRIVESSEVEAALNTLISQKRARFLSQGKYYAARALKDAPFWRMLSQAPIGAPALETYGLFVDARLIAVYCGLPFRDQWHFMLNAYDIAPDVARSSPAEYLLRFVLEDLAARKFRVFELGIGEARYKDNVCNRAVRLQDTFIATSAHGVVGAARLHWMLVAKRYMKRSPWAMRTLNFLSRLRIAREKSD